MNVIVFIILLSIVVYLYKKWIYSYWKRKGLPEVSYTEARKLGLKHFGYYRVMSPVYSPIDLDVIKDILIKKFDHFANRGSFSDAKRDPLSGGLFDLEDDKWKNTRNKLSPTFTSGKMRMMFHTMVESINGLMEILEKHKDKNVPVEALSTMSRYTTDVIGSCAFGIECNTINDPVNSEFRKQGELFNKMSWRKSFRVFGNRNFLKFIRFREHNQETIDFFMNLTKSMVNYRDSNKVARKDFLQLLIELRDKGFVSNDDKLDTVKAKGENKAKAHLTIEEMAAHTHTFFNAGFATSSSTLSFALLEIASNEAIQNKLRSDIKDNLEKHGGINYEAIMSMEYLDKVVNETLRKYPVARAVLRVSNKHFPVSGTDFILEPGVKVNIPIMAIHRDPEYYPDPLKFDPERFSPEVKTSRHPMAYIPFGEGPRICIGFRFALLQMKVGLATIFNKFRLSLNEQTQLPVNIDPRKALMAVDGGCWLDIHSL